MIRKLLKPIISLVILVCLIGVVCRYFGCGDSFDQVTDTVLTAAKTELEKQISAKIAENKIDVVETETAFGKLNDNGEYQFFCALLIQTNSEDNAASAAAKVADLFGEASYLEQTGSTVEHEYLVHKTVTYDHTDFSEGNYYTIYIYVEDITEVVDLSKLSTEST